MTRTSILAGLAVLALALGPTEAAAQIFLYEDWSGSAISPNRWRGGVPFLQFDSGLESRRAMRAGQLVMSMRQATDATGVGRPGMNLLEIADPGPVTSLRARLSVQRYTARAGCDTSKSEVNAALLLSKFKDGAPTAPGDRTNDVVATVFAFNPGHTPLTVHGLVFKCGDAACASFVSIGIGEVHLGDVAVGAQFRPRVTWDEAGDQFLFGLNNGPDVPINYGAVGVTDATAAGKDLAAIAVTASSAGCSTGTNVASVKAAFGEIRTNVPTIVP